MASSLRLVHEARECVGTPYHHLGREKNAGVDCIGLVYVAAKNAEVNVSWFKDTTYGKIPDGRFKEGLDRWFDKVWDVELTPRRSWLPLLKNGDLLSMSWKLGSRPMHIAIAAVGRNSWNIIHAFGGNEKVVEHRLDQLWLDRVRAVYRFKDVK